MAGPGTPRASGLIPAIVAVLELEPFRVVWADTLELRDPDKASQFLINAAPDGSRILLTDLDRSSVYATATGTRLAHMPSYDLYGGAVANDGQVFVPRGGFLAPEFRSPLRMRVFAPDLSLVDSISIGDVAGLDPFDAQVVLPGRLSRGTLYVGIDELWGATGGVLRIPLAGPSSVEFMGVGPFSRVLAVLRT